MGSGFYKDAAPLALGSFVRVFRVVGGQSPTAKYAKYVSRISGGGGEGCFEDGLEEVGGVGAHE